MKILPRLTTPEFRYYLRAIDAYDALKVDSAAMDDLYDEVDRAIETEGDRRLTIGELIEHAALKRTFRAAENGDIPGQSP